MEAVKRAIASALEKGDARDRAFRERVYRQTFAALDRSLHGRQDISAEEARRRREQVKAVIVAIEREHLAAPAAPPPQMDPPAAPREGTPVEEVAPEFAPTVDREDRFAFEEQPQARYLPDGEVRVPPAEGTRRRGRLFALFLAAAAIAAVAIAAWGALRTGILQLPAERMDSGLGGPSPTGPALGDADSETDWIAVFLAEDPTSVSASAGARVEAVAEENETFLRINAETAEATVSFDVGQGVLEELAGRPVVFSLTARAEEGQETQISVSCDFGALGDCGRTRYVVGPLPTEYLLEVDLPERTPTSGGTITVTPDIEGQGRTLDIFSLRAAPAQ